MDKIFGFVEVGSTNTKGYIYKNSNVEIVPLANIQFKKNYKKNSCISSDDKNKLYNYIEKIKEVTNIVHIYGTSIFRDLKDEEKQEFLSEFKDRTGFDFNIVSSEQENKYTVLGAISKVTYNGNIAVMVGGGGSIEIAICNDGKILEIANSNFGGVDVSEKFPDLASQYVTSNRDSIVNFAKERLTKPTLKADVLILAGGDFLLWSIGGKYPMEENTLFKDDRQPYMMKAKEKADYDLEYYYNINLDNMRKLTPDTPNWWNETRAMCAISKSIADTIDAKYLIPTRISMVYGVVEDILKGNV